MRGADLPPCQTFSNKEKIAHTAGLCFFPTEKKQLPTFCEAFSLLDHEDKNYETYRENGYKQKIQNSRYVPYKTTKN